MSNFKREEEKYLVVKASDLQGAGIAKRAAFFGALHGLNIPVRKSLVIEADWPEYEPAWAMIQARVEGTQVVSGGRQAGRNFDYNRGFAAGEAERETLQVKIDALQLRLNAQSERVGLLDGLLRDAIGEIKYLRGEKHACKGLDMDAAEAALKPAGDHPCPVGLDGCDGGCKAE